MSLRSPLAGNGQPLAQRSAVGVAVMGLHVLAAAGLATMVIRSSEPEELPVLSVSWIPTQAPKDTPTPPQPKQAPSKVTPRPTETRTQAPTPTATPLIQAEATAPAATESPRQVAPTPVAAAAEAPPAPRPAPPAPAAPSELNRSVDCTAHQDPIYPATAMRLGEEGQVMLRLQVDEQGHPTRVEVQTGSGSSRLDRAAREGVRNWVCPLRQGRQNTGGWFTVPIIFKL